MNSMNFKYVFTVILFRFLRCKLIHVYTKYMYILYIVQCTIHTVQCTLYTVHSTVYNAHYILYSIKAVFMSEMEAVLSVDNIHIIKKCSLHRVIYDSVYIIHCTMYNVHCTSYTLLYYQNQAIYNFAY